MKLQLIITTLAIFLITAGSFTAYAHHQGGDGYGPPIMSDSESASDKDDWRNKKRQYQHEMATELLGLSDEQVEQIKAIREEEKENNDALRKQMREYRDKMYELTDAGSFDEDAIRALAEEKAAIQVELAVSKARMHSKIHAVMTPEQQELAEKLRSVRKNRKGKHHKGYGPEMMRHRPDFD